MVGGTGRKEKKYIYICIYDKWNYHFEKAMPTPFLYYYYYYYYICLFGWLRRKGEVSRSDISDFIYIYIYIYIYQLTNIIMGEVLLALYAYRYGATIDLISRNY